MHLLRLSTVSPHLPKAASQVPMNNEAIVARLEANNEVHTVIFFPTKAPMDNATAGYLIYQ